MHWADVIAKDILEKDKHPIIATGISPTGVIHVGSLREAITGEAVRSAIKDLGGDVRLIYLIDSVDPLRKRYPFLPEEYEDYVGMPIFRIPCPCGKHDNYAHHFVQPFLDALDSLKVNCEIIWTHDLYAQGKFAPMIDLALRKRSQVIEILKEVTGRDLKDDFAPYNPLCENCGRFAQPLHESYEYPHIGYHCTCGHTGTADITKMEGKLVWRLEWPAKWKMFGTSVEPFGKDHAAAGGSYDSGKRIVEEIFDGKAPYPVPYEFVQLKGIGQMHKSTGSPVTGLDAINMTPPEVLNYLFLRVNPQRAIDYDSGMGILDLADEYDRMERLHFEGECTECEENSVRAYCIAQHNALSEEVPQQVPYRHLVNVVQMTDCFEGVMEILGRTENLEDLTKEETLKLRKRVECVKYWLDRFAPEQVKFSVSDGVGPESLSSEEKKYLALVSDALDSVEWESDSISNVVVETAKEAGISTKKGFQTIYKALIGRTSGPRLGTFLADMDRENVLERFRSVSP
ncbi:MAG: lysine--tRNA ligase [Thermoplasmatales archaeon]|nr:lysine--tRNA ligase [Thermoplasmatales archaeon]